MFAIGPEDIRNFDALKLVQLLRMLMYAEARKAGVPLRNVDVPLQITVADGGQDAAVQWEDGAASTEYFPTRDVVFQCKATDGGDAKWKAEVWTKPTQPGRVKTKELNDAVKGALDRGACYIGITASALVGTKATDRAAAIRAGITQAGGDPSLLAAVEVYDRNKLAAWASDHPAVALWVHEQASGKSYQGFSTIDQWGQRAELASPPFVEDDDRAFSIGKDRADILRHSQLAGRLVDHLNTVGACARVWGASGIGKSRALYQALAASVGAIRGLAAANYIFCDFNDGVLAIRDVANTILKSGASAVLVVDNCPFEDAKSLNEMARAKDSQLRIVTIGAEGRDDMAECVTIRPLPVNGSVIHAILKAALTKASPDEINYIARFCDGFPSIAVLAAKSYGTGRAILKSAHDVAERIIGDAKLDRDTVRALEGLSLFDDLAPDKPASAFDRIAEQLVHTSGGLMFEHLVIASEQHLVGRTGDRMTTQPRPIADYLAMRRLSYLRPSVLVAFLLNADPAVQRAMLQRWQYLARSPTLSEVARLLLNGDFSEPDALLAYEADPFLVPFVHVAPDAILRSLWHAIIPLSLDALAEFQVTEELVRALRLLALRRATFKPAVEIVIHLAAVADREGTPPIRDLLRGLFQIALAGTEADDQERRTVLVELLDEADDPRIIRACIDALAAMLQTYIARSGDIEQVGDEPFRREWRPQDQAAVGHYFSWAIQRLQEIWRDRPVFRAEIEELVAGELRSLIGFDIFPVIEAFVREVVKANGHFIEATKTIGDWLYFDRPESETDFSRAVRSLYDATLPSDPVLQALLYCRFWAADIHDPDQRYSEVKDKLDFEYSARQVRALAPRIAADPSDLARIVTIMSSEEMKAPYALAEALVDHVDDPLGIFTLAVTTLDASETRRGAGFVLSLLSAIDRKIKDDAKLTELVAIAQASTILTPIDIYSALRVTDARLEEITAEVRAGRIEPGRVVAISYGRGLADIAPAALAPLIDALVALPEDEGPWAALEILSMYTHEMKSLLPGISTLVKVAILAPSIADGVEGNSASADYVHDRMLQMLAAQGEIDDEFARAFALQIERACRSKAGRYGRGVDALRSALKIVVEIRPKEVWAVLAGFYETATRAERERLADITSATKRFAFDVTRTGPGVLFATPTEQILNWVAGDPDDRIGFLLGFYPILEGQDGNWSWHPALRQLAGSFGDRKAFRTALRARIFPSSWGGSLNAHLTSFKAPLAAWAKDAVLGDWARATLLAVENSLESGFYS